MNLSDIKDIAGLKARIDAKTDRSGDPGGCHLWTGAVMTAGYGAVKVAFADGARKTVGVHRLVTAIKTGYMPPRSIEAMHSCDNRLCVNPDHLSWGTVADNAEDRSAKGRSARSLGEKNGRAVLSKDDVANIRASNQTQTELADHYGVSQSTISLVKSGQTWKPSHKPLSLVADQHLKADTKRINLS